MDISTEKWLTDLEVDDLTLAYNGNSLDILNPEQLAATACGGEDFQHSYSSPNFSHYPSFDVQEIPWIRNQIPSNQFKTPQPTLPRRTMLSFDSSHSCVNQNNERKVGQKDKRTTTSSTTNSSQTQHHVIAERERRHKLRELIISLSRLIPGITKMDKVSVLGDCIKYIKQLQERVKKLEEKKVESIVLSKKCEVASENGSSSTVDSNESKPEIKARISGRNVLIQIQCEKQKGILVKMLAEAEKLNLSIVNSSVMPFGSSTLDISVMAQMDDGFNMTMTDLVKELRSLFI